MKAEHSINLQALINECAEAMVEAINEECDDKGARDAQYASTAVNTNDGWIELDMDRWGNKHAIIAHDNGSDHECPLLCKAIEDALPDWHETVEDWERESINEDEWDEHGFADEADYLRYRYG